ncbi:MAG: hypothetical protein ACM3ML_22610 [Micromonosporaceae bacterium]
MCSDNGDPLTVLIQAIEALAAESLSPSAAADLTERIAGVWTLIVDMDPELAERAAKYRPSPP